MKKTMLIPMLSACLATFSMPGAAQQTGLAAELSCEAAQARLAYRCALQMTDRASGKPVDGLEIQVKADMPSMPMAHNIPPVKAQATAESGRYDFPITLDMYGRWAFSITISGAQRDRLVEALDFAAPEGEGHHSHKH